MVSHPCPVVSHPRPCGIPSLSPWCRIPAPWCHIPVPVVSHPCSMVSHPRPCGIPSPSLWCHIPVPVVSHPCSMVSHPCPVVSHPCPRAADASWQHPSWPPRQCNPLLESRVSFGELRKYRARIKLSAKRLRYTREETSPTSLSLKQTARGRRGHCWARACPRGGRSG